MITNATINKTNQELDMMAAEADVAYVAAIFENVNDAKRAYKRLNDAQRDGTVQIIDAAYVEKTEDDWVKIHDHADWVAGEHIAASTIASGVAVGLIGVVAGAILIPAAIGALVGGVIMSVYERKPGFPNIDLWAVGDTLPVGTSALVAIVKQDILEVVELEIKNQGATNVHSSKIPKSTAAVLAG